MYRIHRIIHENNDLVSHNYIFDGAIIILQMAIHCTKVNVLQHVIKMVGDVNISINSRKSYLHGFFLLPLLYYVNFNYWAVFRGIEKL